ncbi:MAG: response regulator [Candidatus Thermoplasmatota archaeon]
MTPPPRPDPRTPSKPIEILLVEDNPDDVELTVEALADSKVLNRISIARDGVEAIDFVNKRGQFADAPTPDVILLDLNMPRKSGREVLAELKADPNHRHIPIIILTTSSAEEDILRSYKLQASAYVVKPVDFNRFVEVVKAIDTFWFNVASYPAGK